MVSGKTASDVLDHVINMQGVAQAQSAAQINGSINQISGGNSTDSYTLNAGGSIDPIIGGSGNNNTIIAAIIDSAPNGIGQQPSILSEEWPSITIIYPDALEVNNVTLKPDLTIEMTKSKFKKTL